MITKNGTVSEYLSYYPYGEIRAKPIASVDVRHKFTGQEYDDETGLYFYGARYYDPALARFISPDNTNRFDNDPQKLNRYSYVLNNPVRYKDQTGKYEKDFHYYLTGLLAYYAGFSPQEALQIAIANQGIDENIFTGPWLSDLSREEYHAFIGYFSSADAVLNKVGPMRSAIPKGDLRAFGGFLHFVQDYYSHAKLGFGMGLGHLRAEHKPDYPFENPENATDAAKQTIEELQMKGEKEGKTSIKSEDDIISSLFPFIHNRSNNADIRAQDLSNMDPASFEKVFGNELSNKIESNKTSIWDNLPPD